MTPRLIAAAACCLLAAGCSPFAPAPTTPQETAQADPLALPAASRSASVPGLLWWKEFGSTELNRLEDEALSASFDIRTARANLAKASAQARQAAAGLMTTVTASASAGKSRVRAAGERSSSRSVTAGPTASYEVDVWGRVEAAARAGHFTEKASAEDLAAARMTVSASVADAWIQVLAARQEIAVVRRQIRTNEDLYAVRRTQYENGQAQGIDLIQQKETLEGVKTRQPALEVTLRQALNTLAVLTGRVPSDNLALVRETTLPAIGAVPGAGLPAELIGRRPDIRAAWLRVQAAGWNVTQAEANRLPALTLSASLLFEAAHPAELFRSWTRRLAAALSGTVFDGGSLAAAADAARAERDATVVAYVQTVAQALEEVSNAYTADSQQRKLLQAYESQLRLARIALAQAERAWLNGVDTFSRYMTQLEDVQSLERSVAAQQGVAARARVTLYRVIGAGTAQQQQEAAK